MNGSPRRRTLADWAELLLTVGTAAVIGSIGTFATDRIKVGRDHRAQQCEIAAAFLSDETPSPYIPPQSMQRLTRAAAETFDQCMTER